MKHNVSVKLGFMMMELMDLANLAIILGIAIFNKYFYSISDSCSQGNFTDCLTCLDLSNREINETSGECLCLNGYFDDGENSECPLCHYSWFLFYFNIFS